MRDSTCLEKDAKECSCLICDSSGCRTSCVGVQPCTPKILPNTETFLHSRVFFVTCISYRPSGREISSLSAYCVCVGHEGRPSDLHIRSR